MYYKKMAFKLNGRRITIKLFPDDNSVINLQIVEIQLHNNVGVMLWTPASFPAFIY